MCGGTFEVAFFFKVPSRPGQFAIFEALCPVAQLARRPGVRSFSGKSVLINHQLNKKPRQLVACCVPFQNSDWGDPVEC